MPLLRRTLGPLDVALDLGTSEQRLWVPRRGLALDAAHAAAPVRRGIVVDAAAAASRIRPRLRVARRFGFVRPSVLACVPSSMTSDERAVVDEACAEAGARAVRFVLAPLAAAIGAGVDVSSAYAQAIVDVGDGLTDFAVLRGGEVLESETIPVGMSDARGGTGDDVIAAITGFVARSLRSLPAELGCEAVETPLVVTGGGASSAAITGRLRAATGFDVRVPAAPAHAVIRGAAAMVDYKM